MIEILNVNKTYNGKTKAACNLNLTVNDGEIFGFIGHNGAGKTTLIKMIAGILRQDSGTIRLNGTDTLENPLASKKQFGYVPDSPDMFLRLKGIEYLNFLCDVHEVPQDVRRKKIENLAERFEMASVLGDQIQSYSHGMRQKMVVMGALLHDPSIWILDEPLTGLDPRSAYLLKEMMKEHVAAGKSVFFSTHVLEVAEKLCDKIAIINKGEIIYCGTLDELKERYKEQESLESIFLEMTKNE